MGTSAQTDACATEASLAFAMHSACLLAVPPPHLAVQLLQGVYAQWGPLHPVALHAGKTDMAFIGRCMIRSLKRSWAFLCPASCIMTNKCLGMAHQHMSAVRLQVHILGNLASMLPVSQLSTVQQDL